MPRLRSIGIINSGIAPRTGGYRIPRPGARTGFDSAGDRRSAPRRVNGWATSSAQIPRQANVFQRVVTGADARRKGIVKPSSQFADDLTA